MATGTDSAQTSHSEAAAGALPWPAKIGVALSVGVLGGVGINTAHEMGHKKDSL